MLNLILGCLYIWMCHLINVLVHILTGFLHHRACSKINTNCLPFQRTWVHLRFFSDSYYSIFIFKCMFCRSLFVLFYFFLGHCVVCSSSIYDYDYLIRIFKFFIEVRLSPDSTVALKLKTNTIPHCRNIPKSNYKNRRKR